MRYYFTFIGLIVYSLSMAQEGISLNIYVSADTIYMENAFRIQYSVKNGSANGFQNPELKDFQLLQGPSRSSQTLFIDGTRSSEESYTYYFKPNKEGSYNLEPFELEIDGKLYTSNRPKIIVIANPDSLHQDPNTGQVEGRPMQKKKVSKRKRFKI